MKNVGRIEVRGRRTDVESTLPLYMREMGREPLLTREQETELATEFREGRGALAEAARRLPAAVRRQAFGTAAGPPADASEWDVIEIERFLERLAQSSRHSPAEVVARIRSAHRRLERARSRLTVANLRLVVHIARRYTGNGLSLMDLIQDGNLGLLRAVEKFDIGLGNRFSTYAYWWIKQAIERAITDKSREIRVPVHLEEKRKRVKRATRALAEQLHRAPTREEVAERVGMRGEQVQEVMAAVHDLRSLDEARDNRRREAYQVPDPSPRASAFLQLELRERTATIEEALRRLLSGRERRIIRLRFGIGESRAHTLDQVGRIVRLSRERVRQLEQQALDKLRRSEVLAEILSTLGSA